MEFIRKSGIKPGKYGIPDASDPVPRQAESGTVGLECQT